jgi:hypothetical protein
MIMYTPSILAEAFCEHLFTTARKNLERDGFLAPVMFVNVGTRSPVIVPLMYPPSSQEKQRYFIELGIRFRTLGQTILEAVMLMESWTVNAQTAPSALRFLPSQHPSRREAIALIGRNATNNCVTFVMQLFTKGKNNHLVWGERPMAFYNKPAEEAAQPSGLLDYLFLANQAR